jgi:hypothetical protein
MWPALTRSTANRRIARRRVRIEPVNRNIKHCRIVHDTDRLRRAGVRNSVTEVRCASHDVRVCLTLWQPLVEPE